MIEINKINDNLGFIKISDIDIHTLSLNNIQNILMLDCSGSMSDIITEIISYWNNNYSKLDGDFKIILFATRSVITCFPKIEPETLYKIGKNTNIIKGLSKLKEILELQSQIFNETNVIFITDGKDNTNNDFDNIFPSTIDSFSKVTNNLNLYPLGIEDEVFNGSKLFKELYKRIHTGKIQTPCFHQANNSAESVIKELNRIFVKILTCVKVKVTSNVQLYKNMSEICNDYVDQNDYIIVKDLQNIKSIEINNKLFDCKIVNSKSENIVDIIDVLKMLTMQCKLCQNSNNLKHIIQNCDIVKEQTKLNLIKVLDNVIISDDFELLNDFKLLNPEHYNNFDDHFTIELLDFVKIVKDTRLMNLSIITNFDKTLLSFNFSKKLNIESCDKNLILRSFYDQLDKIKINDSQSVPIVLNKLLNTIVKSKLFQKACENNLGDTHEKTLCKTLFLLLKEFTSNDNEIKIIKLAQTFLHYKNMKQIKLLWWNPERFVNKFDLDLLIAMILATCCDKTKKQIEVVFKYLKKYFTNSNEITAIDNLKIIILKNYF